MKDICVFTYKKANELISEGYNLLRILPSKKNNEQNILVFYFENTYELRRKLNIR